MMRLRLLKENKFWQGRLKICKLKSRQKDLSIFLRMHKKHQGDAPKKKNQREEMEALASLCS